MQKEKIHITSILKPIAAMLAIVLIVSVFIFFIQKHADSGNAQRDNAVQEDVKRHVGGLGKKAVSIEKKEDGIYDVATESGNGLIVMTFDMPTRYTGALCVCMIDKKTKAVVDSWIFPEIYADSYDTHVEEGEDGREALVLTSSTTGGTVCTWDIEAYIGKLDMTE